MGYPGAKAFVATYYCSICIPSTASLAKDETILLAIYCSLQFGTIICVNHDSYLFPATSNSYSLLSIFSIICILYIQTIVVVAPAFDFVSDSYLYPFPA